MKIQNWHKEDYKFKITVIAVGLDGKPERCRNDY